MAAMTTLVAVVGSGAAAVISATAEMVANVTIEKVGEGP